MNKMTIFLSLLTLTWGSFSYGQDRPTDGLSVGQRIVYEPDSSAGTLIGIDDYQNTVCVKFDYPRYDGAYERCGIFAYLIAPQTTSAPSDHLNVGQRVVYTPDNSSGDLISIDRYRHTVCIKFDLVRYDGAYERCNIQANLVTVRNRPRPSARLQAGQRVIYTVDQTAGDLIKVDRYSNTVCVKFDYPRPDGAFERCGISATLIRPWHTPTPTEDLMAGQRIIYTPDNSLGDLIKVDRYHHTVCIKFDYPRPDGAYERCNVNANLVNTLD